MIKRNRLYQVDPVPYQKLDEVEKQLPEVAKYTSNITCITVYENDDIYVSFGVEGALMCITKRALTGKYNWGYELKDNLILLKALLLQNSTFKSKFIKNIRNDDFKLIGV